MLKSSVYHILIIGTNVLVLYMCWVLLEPLDHLISFNHHNFMVSILSSNFFQLRKLKQRMIKLLG